MDFTLSNCLNSGLSRVPLLTQYKHEELQNYIQQSWGGLWTGMMREPLVCLPPSEGNRYRGTADAVFQNIAAVRQRRPEFVLILSGDQVYYMDYRELLRHHGETKSSVLMSGVRVGKDTRIRHAIIEESVHIPAGFQIGFDLENDRKH